MPTRLGPGDYRDVPWKNGGGTTRELVRLPHPHDPARFFVRLSIATVASSGPFSSFAGVDRTLVLLDGDGMALSFGAGSPEVVLAHALRPLSFPGEAPVEARLLGGATRDFNLMVDRGVGGASLRIERFRAGRERSAEEGTLLVHVLGGRVAVGTDMLTAGETLVVEATSGERLRGDGVALVVRAWQHPAGA